MMNPFTWYVADVGSRNNCCWQTDINEIREEFHLHHPVFVNCSMYFERITRWKEIIRQQGGDSSRTRSLSYSPSDEVTLSCPQGDPIFLEWLKFSYRCPPRDVMQCRRRHNSVTQQPYIQRALPILKIPSSDQCQFIQDKFHSMECRQCQRVFQIVQEILLFS